MEERELEYFCEWLIENKVVHIEYKGNKWKTAYQGSTIYTTEQLVKKYCNEESL